MAADIPKERTPGKDEKPEDKAKLDKEFKDQQQKLEDKLAQEQAYEKWVYLVSSWTVDSLLKDRSQLLVEKKGEPKKDEQPAAVFPRRRKNDRSQPPRLPNRTRIADFAWGIQQGARARCLVTGHSLEPQSHGKEPIAVTARVMRVSLDTPRTLPGHSPGIKKYSDRSPITRRCGSRPHGTHRAISRCKYSFNWVRSRKLTAHACL